MKICKEIPKPYYQDIIYATSELVLHILIAFIGLFYERHKVNLYVFIGITITCQLLVLAIAMRAMKVNIQSGNANEKLMNTVCAILLRKNQEKLDKVEAGSVSADRFEDVSKRISALQAQTKGEIQYSGKIIITLDQKANYAISLLASSSLIYILLIFLIPLLYKYHIVGIKTITFMAITSIICGAIIPIIFRSASIIGSRHNIKRNQSLIKLIDIDIDIDIVNSKEDKELEESSSNQSGQQDKYITKILAHFKNKQVHYQEISLAVCEAILSISLAVLIFLKQLNKINVWLFATLICIGKVFILTLIMRALYFSINSNHEVNELAKKIPIIYKLDDNGSKSSSDINNKTVADKGGEFINREEINKVQRYSMYAVFSFQAIYIGLSTVAPLLYQYKNINIMTHMIISISGFIFGNLTLIAFRLIVTMNFRDNKETIEKLIEDINSVVKVQNAKEQEAEPGQVLDDSQSNEEDIRTLVGDTTLPNNQEMLVK